MMKGVACPFLCGLCFVGFTSEVLGSCALYERKCDDGSCVRMNRNCPGRCDSPIYKQCENGSCVHKYVENCPGECRSHQIMCDDGSCVFSWKKCPGVCDLGEKKCPDGTCVNIHRELCPGECEHGEKKCPDGSCVDKYTGRCSGECAYREKRCYDGTCVNKYRERCWDEVCPATRPLPCGSRYRACYSEGNRCNHLDDCPNGKDEEDCDSFGLKGWWYFLLIPVMTFMFLLVCLYKYCKYKEVPSEQSTSTARTNNSSTQVTAAVTDCLPPSPSQDYEPGAPPSYESVVAIHPCGKQQDKQGLPSYEDVSDIPPWTIVK